ncbi:hypothetical protein [Mycobacterium sp. IDR2000157661]|uniref:hypothetical protein n=1 Tax=Mycobacterium sp. IDR2000157661 TaxID=2867005 RepID=UPI001EED9D95|nr:hypothetical protein [Mycobacterium sp. IDR2000157661]ULE34994.1 hypothetical protein K3G64_10730 [Mycobacterium sp. IDR2000157661]
MTNQPCVRRLVRTAVVASGFAVTAALFTFPANAEYKEQDFASCLERDMPTDYCCEHAGGVMRTGACIDPETLKNAVEPANPALPPRQLPDVTGPPLTEVDPGRAPVCTLPIGCTNAPPAIAVNPAP